MFTLSITAGAGYILATPIRLSATVEVKTALDRIQEQHPPSAVHNLFDCPKGVQRLSNQADLNQLFSAKDKTKKEL
jgi:hypothetical protein